MGSCKYASECGCYASCPECECCDVHCECCHKCGEYECLGNCDEEDEEDD